MLDRDMLRSVLIGVLIALLLAPVVIMVGRWGLKSRERPRSVTCLSHEKQLMLALLTYAQDHEDRLPNALVWAQKIKVKHPMILSCVQDERKQVISYDMVQRWSGQPVSQQSPTKHLIVLYEIGPRGLDYSRHNGGMNLGYMDGHVKWRSAQDAVPDVVLSGSDEVTPDPHRKP